MRSAMNDEMERLKMKHRENNEVHVTKQTWHVFKTSFMSTGNLQKTILLNNDYSYFPILAKNLSYTKL